jgi:DNA-binding transcriptional LysR family regulator
VPMVAACLGVSIVPQSTGRIHIDGVFYLPIDGDAPRAEIALAHRRVDRSAAVANFVAVARRAVEAAGQHESHDIATDVDRARVRRR